MSRLHPEGPSLIRRAPQVSSLHRRRSPNLITPGLTVGAPTLRSTALSPSYCAGKWFESTAAIHFDGEAKPRLERCATELVGEVLTSRFVRRSAALHALQRVASGKTNRRRRIGRGRV